MSDWIVRSEIVPPPWLEADVKSPVRNFSESTVSVYVSDVDDVGFSASDGMVLGIGMSVSCVAVVVASVVATRW